MEMILIKTAVNFNHRPASNDRAKASGNFTLFEGSFLQCRALRASVHWPSRFMARNM